MKKLITILLSNFIFLLSFGSDNSKKLNDIYRYYKMNNFPRIQEIKEKAKAFFLTVNKKQLGGILTKNYLMIIAPILIQNNILQIPLVAAQDKYDKKYYQMPTNGEVKDALISIIFANKEYEKKLPVKKFLEIDCNKPNFLVLKYTTSNTRRRKDSIGALLQEGIKKMEKKKVI
jgi:hypothetical protein